jgi:7-cyano-7-deazaguanine reductase
MSYEELQGRIRGLELPSIETFENIYADREYAVRLEIDEFNSICPKTGLPDFASFVLEYVPGSRLAEMKSLKLYVTAYRNIGIFQENAANRFLDDFVRDVRPRRAVLTATFNARGGMRTVVTARFPRD